LFNSRALSQIIHTRYNKTKGGFDKYLDKYKYEREREETGGYLTFEGNLMNNDIGLLHTKRQK